MSERNLPRDPVRDLQAAARRAADHSAPGHLARRVVVLGEGGVKLMDVPVPACPCGPEPGGAAEAGAAPGWSSRGDALLFDGEPVPIRGRNLDVLRVLAASELVTVDELRAAWSGYKAEDATVRWQVGELKKALKKLFGDFEGELIEATGAGYRLLLR